LEFSRSFFLKESKMNKNLLQRELVQGDQTLDQAYITRAKVERPQTIQRVTFPLDAAQSEYGPKEINFPFKSFFVESASDPNTYVYVRPNTKDEVQSYFKVSNRDSWTVEKPIAQAFIHWPAQAGKSITIVFFSDAEFRSGSQQSVSSGGVSINEGSSITDGNVTLVAATPKKIFDQNFNRKVATWYNDLGAVARVGGSSLVSATLGIPVPPGGIYVSKNTAEIWAYCSVGGVTTTQEEV
jgi:hypothetical protein